MTHSARMRCGNGVKHVKSLFRKQGTCWWGQRFWHILMALFNILFKPWNTPFKHHKGRGHSISICTGSCWSTTTYHMQPLKHHLPAFCYKKSCDPTLTRWSQRQWKTVLQQQKKQIKQRGQVTVRVFTPGDTVLPRNDCRGRRWIPATVIAQTGPVLSTI